VPIIKFAKSSNGIDLGRLDFYKMINKFYLFLVENVPWYSNITEIKEYHHLLIDTLRVRTQYRGVSKEQMMITHTVFNNYPLYSKYRNIIQAEYILTDKTTVKANFNTNTDNLLIRSILKRYLMSLNGSRMVCDKGTRLFVYYFTESLGNQAVLSPKDFNEESFSKQYSFFVILDTELRRSRIYKSVKELKHILIDFYRYLVFELNDQSRFFQAIYSKNFYKMYEDGYAFVYHNKLENVPSQDKFCILPAIQTLHNTNTKNTSWVPVNLTEIPLLYREDVKRYIWYCEGSAKDIMQYFYKLKEFLEMNMTYKEMYKNVISPESKEFKQDFLWEYRNLIELESDSCGQIKGVFKAIRKYIKYYENKYQVDKSDIDILNLKGLVDFNGGNPITENDCKIIYKGFKDNLYNVTNDRIYTIAFELFMLSNLRIGEILNLTRDCINKQNNGETCLVYLSKTSNKEYVEQLVPETIVSLVNEAISITQQLLYENDIMSKYIFVEPYRAVHIYRNKRINFCRCFNTIVKKVGKDLEINNYVPYNIRHTYINNVYKEGTQHGLTLAEMAAITGNSYKTANMYYRKYNEIDLYVEAMANVTITDVDIFGNILDREESDELKIVKNNLCLL
jgi:integrase